jgi:VWFA-related protein
MKRTVREWIGPLFLVAVTASAQQAPPTPTFQAGTRLVEVDVIARSKDGPAKGLTQGDFTLLDNGKPQKISLFSVKSSQVSASAAGPASVSAAVPASHPLPSGVVTNRVAPAGESSKTATALLIDQRNTTQVDQGFALQRVVKFIEMQKTRDRIGIYAFGRGGLQVLQDLTDDAELLRRAASQLKARDPGHICGAELEGRAGEECTRSEMLGRMLDTKHAVEGVARRMAKVPGRKNLVWVTSSFPIIGRDYDFTPDMEESAHVLNNASVTLYAVDARGLIGALSGTTAISNAESRGSPQAAQMQARKLGIGPSGIDTLNLLTGRTGGDRYFNSNGIEESIQTAIDDGELTYTLGFYPAQDQKEGLWHNLKVEIATPGVKLRYRQNYFSGRTPDGTNERLTLEELFKDPTNATQVELLAEARPDETREKFVQIKVTVDPHNLVWQSEDGRRSGGVDVSYSLVGSTNWQTKTAKFSIPDDLFAEFLGRGSIDTVQSIDTTGGVSAVRVVVQDRNTGAAGSVTIPLKKR